MLVFGDCCDNICIPIYSTTIPYAMKYQISPFSNNISKSLFKPNQNSLSNIPIVNLFSYVLTGKIQSFRKNLLWF